MATRSGADTLLMNRRELMFPTLTTEQVAGIGNTGGAAGDGSLFRWFLNRRAKGASAAMIQRSRLE
jgi:hypothetical protein